MRRRLRGKLNMNTLMGKPNLAKSELREVTGFRGEKIVELRLTDYEAFQKPLFRPGFLGDKWPAIDFYVELAEVVGQCPYFFAQVKSTTADLTAQSIKVTTKKRDIDRLLQLPGPTYIFGVHEPTQRVFVRSVHQGMPVKAITTISLQHELNSNNLRKLHDEVRRFWLTSAYKPSASEFV